MSAIGMWYAYLGTVLSLPWYSCRLIKWWATSELAKLSNVWGNNIGGLRCIQKLQSFVWCALHVKEPKTSYQKPVEKLHFLSIPAKLWNVIRMNFIGPFSESKEFNYLWDVICCHNKHGAPDFSAHNYESIWIIVGLPQRYCEAAWPSKFNCKL